MFRVNMISRNVKIFPNRPQMWADRLLSGSELSSFHDIPHLFIQKDSYLARFILKRK